MKEKTIDYLLRSTWMGVTKMYNEEAGKKGSTMATGFALISIDPDEGTPSTSLGPKMGIVATSLSRTLKNIRLKERVYTNEALDALKNNQIDTSDISNLLLKGDVLFSQSNTKLDSCDVYVIEGAHKGKPKEKLKISVENCNKIATIQKISIIK